MLRLFAAFVNEAVLCLPLPAHLPCRLSDRIGVFTLAIKERKLY